MHRVTAKGLLSSQNGMNIYRGCSHGCIYCDSRSLCYNFTHEFEDIEVKENAPELLEQALRSKRKKCMIGTGSMSDPYMHIEEELKLTRKCLEIIDQYGFGVAVQTKSSRILRDMDLFQSIHEKAKSVIQMTLTTFDEKLCRIIEPNVCGTRERYETLKEFQKNNIPTVVWISPILPFINDSKENLTGLLEYCADAGVKGIINFGMGVTLRDGDREYFYRALDRSLPGMKKKYQQTFGNAYECMSPNEAELTAYFHRFCEKYHIMSNRDEVFQYLHEYPEKFSQMKLSDFL